MDAHALRMAASEINQIFRYTEEQDVNKVPLGLRLFLKDIEAENYFPEINPEISLSEQKLLPETEKLLGMIYCFYWSSQEELEQMPKHVLKEAQVVNEEILNGYTEEKFFEEAKQRHEEKLKAESLTTVPKEPWYKRLFHWFRKK